MAIIDSDLLDDFGHLLAATDGPTLTDDCLWCVVGGSHHCPHHVGGVVDGVVRLDGLPTSISNRLEGLLGRLARSIVAAEPLPEECRDLPGGDRLAVAAEAAWTPWREAGRRDPDVEGWTAALVDRLAETYASWLYGLCCTLSGGTMHRLDEPDGGERWMAAEPDLLGAEIDACLRGEGAAGPFAGDPLRRATARSA